MEIWAVSLLPILSLLFSVILEENPGYGVSYYVITRSYHSVSRINYLSATVKKARFDWSMLYADSNI